MEKARFDSLIINPICINVHIQSTDSFGNRLRLAQRVSKQISLIFLKIRQITVNQSDRIWPRYLRQREAESRVKRQDCIDPFPPSPSFARSPVLMHRNSRIRDARPFAKYTSARGTTSELQRIPFSLPLLFSFPFPSRSTGRSTLCKFS